jgi:hypothetical protein
MPDGLNEMRYARCCEKSVRGLRRSEYLETPEGKLAQYRPRNRQRLRIEVSDIEPRSKQGDV